MHEKTGPDVLKTETERGCFARAAIVASQRGLPESEIKRLRCEALGQMAALYRNAHGTEQLARQYGFPGDELKQVLEAFANELKNKGNHKPLEPCYDYSTGKYLSFEEWIAYYSKNWGRL